FRKEELAGRLSKKEAELREAEAALANAQRLYGIAPAMDAPTPSFPDEQGKEPVFLDEEENIPPAAKAAPEPSFPDEGIPEEDGFSKVKLLEATLARIRLELTEAEEEMKKLAVSAPIAGMIQARQVTEGSAVQAGEPLFEIVALNPITLSFFVPQEVSAYVDKFIKVTASPNVAPEQVADGTVFYISPSVDPVKKTLEIRMHLPNEAGIIREGQEGKAFVSTRKMEKVLIAPPEVVKAEGDKNFIYVVGGNKVEKTEVQVGPKSAKGIELDANLRVDDPIVISPPAELQDGSFIKIRETLPLVPIS
ncbi:MAG: efflux RND transporter periplasmic adaptor subunit, partial [Deltaproteobacteria bacterium]|nr:efflux RND transporter periplasmic adaptor subunit [Deltaproteobacteria bacterium]